MRETCHGKKISSKNLCAFLLKNYGRSYRIQKVNPLGLTKTEIPNGRGGLTILEFRGHGGGGGGVMHFGISEGKGGLKYGSRPSFCTDIFWNCPLNISKEKFIHFRFLRLNSTVLTTKEVCVK